MQTRLSLGMSTPEMRGMAYPCLCLCLGFWQITRTTPLRRTTLQSSQIRLTDDLTFMVKPRLMLILDDGQGWSASQAREAPHISGVPEEAKH
jgi:hypothetical protein